MNHCQNTLKPPNFDCQQLLNREILDDLSKGFAPEGIRVTRTTAPFGPALGSVQRADSVHRKGIIMDKDT